MISHGYMTSEELIQKLDMRTEENIQALKMRLGRKTAYKKYESLELIHG